MCNLLFRESPIPGSKGLSLFYLETRVGSKMNGIQITRLKDKLGTRQLPTGELILDGTTAHMVCLFFYDSTFC